MGKRVRVAEIHKSSDEIEVRILEPLTDEQLVAAANLDMRGSGFYSVRMMTRAEIEAEYPAPPTQADTD